MDETERIVLTARLRSAGLRATPQRIAILAALTLGEHVSPEEVYMRVDELIPGLNRSTVYRTLELFQGVGIVSETDLGGDTHHYELLDKVRHHHLVCQGCGVILELGDELIHPLRHAIAARYDFASQIDHLAIFGLCANCHKQAPH